MSFKRIFALVLCTLMLCVTLAQAISVSAASQSELEAELKKLQQQSASIENQIANLKKDKAKQQDLKKALESRISNLQSQINLCNSVIEKNNAVIAANEKEIAQKNKEMEKTILDFKKRIRAIYMSNSTAGGLEVLLGAESFSDFIALSQLTQNVSKRDKKMVNEIVDEIKVINEKSAENKKLIEEQKAIKADLVAKQKDLDADVAEINSVISTIQKNSSSLSAELKKLENQYNETMNSLGNPEGGIDIPFDGSFTWPVPGYTNRTSEYGPRWNSSHAGIDISQGGIANARVVAAASGTVTVYCKTCTHNYGKWSNGKVWSCGCGGGYGNWLKIEHGRHNGISYRTVYAHLAPGSITVSTGQYVKRGQMVGRVGTTGRSTGNHLHFEIRQDGVAKNPMNWY